MLGEVFEQYHIMRQAFAPLRLSRWQMVKLLSAQVYRDHPLAVKLTVVAAVVLSFWAFSKWSRPKSLPDLLGLPLIGGDGGNRANDFLKVITEGRAMYPDTPYIVNASGLQYVVYPPAYFDEIKRLTEKEASAQDFFHTVTYGNYTHIGAETDALWKTIAIDLARSVPVKVPSKQKDARISFDKFVGYCPDWTPVTLFPSAMKIVAATNACSFVGRDLARGEWPSYVRRLPMAVYFAVMTLSWIPSLLKPISKPFLLLPALFIERQMRKIIEPVVRADMEEFESAADKKGVCKPTGDGKLPFTHWLMARYKPSEATLYQLTTDQILTSFESTSSTAATLYNLVLDLATRPELQEELRQEVLETMVDGQLPATHLKELRKMDSVMRETFRASPFGLFSLLRITRQPLQLSSGPKIPAGTVICVDSHHINNNGKLFPNPSTYDPHRFLKLRAQPGAEQRHQFVSTGPLDPNWGDGTQACPGRFFANSTLKCIMAHMLLTYKIKLAEGQKRPSMVCMPNGIWAPDMVATALFRSRD